MLKNISISIFSITEKYCKRLPFTPVYGLARSLMALCTLTTLLFTSRELLNPIYYNKLDKDYFLNKITLFNIFGSDHVYFNTAFCFFVLFWVISGWIPQISSIFHWWVAYSFFLTIPIVEGGDQIVEVGTLLLIPVCVFDKRLNHWDSRSDRFFYGDYVKIFGNFIILIVKVQVAFLYFQAAVDKLKVQEWLNGTAIYYWSTNNVFGAPGWLQPVVKPFLENSFLVTIIDWGTIFFEILVAGAIFMTDKHRKTLFPFAIIFHLLIALMLGLISFFFAMAGILILYLIPVDSGVLYFKSKIEYRVASEHKAQMISAS